LNALAHCSYNIFYKNGVGSIKSNQVHEAIATHPVY